MPLGGEGLGGGGESWHVTVYLVRNTYRGGENRAGAKFGTAKCGTAKLYHILPWYLRTEATFLPLPNLCTFSLHYKSPRVRIVRFHVLSLTMIMGRLWDKFLASRSFFCSSKIRSSSLPQVSAVCILDLASYWGHYVFTLNPVSQVSCRESRWLTCRSTTLPYWKSLVHFPVCP